MPKHTIDISKETNDKIKYCKIAFGLNNISDVIEFAISKIELHDYSTE